MRSKVQEKKLAIALRKKGYSYKDILQEIPVAKSSLSLWLKDLPLTYSEKKYLKKRKDANISRGRIKSATALQDNRKRREQILYEEAQKIFKECAHDHLFQVGIALYWAEGAKRNTYFSFSNSDSDMVLLMIRWMERYLNVNRASIHSRLYIHKPYAHEGCEEYWAGAIGIPRKLFKKTVYKPTGRLVKKRPSYKGVLRISTNAEHLKKMKYWMQMLIECYRGV